MLIHTPRPVRTLFLLAALGASSHALAQWVWVDEHGVKQFSDVAPPPNIPPDHILKQPHGGATLPPPSDAPAAADKAPMTTAEKNADFNKRKQEQAEKAKKADEEVKRQAAKTDNCSRATGYLAGLKNGERITTTNANGDRSYLSDDDRAKEQARVQSVIDSNCQ